MRQYFEFSTEILDTFAVLSSFNFAESIWTKYEKYAIPKIEDATLKIRGTLFYIKSLTPEQAQRELISLDQINPIFVRLQSKLECIDNQ
jgi:hypothetical protein